MDATGSTQASLCYSVLASMVAFALFRGPSAVAKGREDFLRRIRSRKVDLEQREAELHAAMHPDVAAILKGKSLLLFKELLE